MKKALLLTLLTYAFTGLSAHASVLDGKSMSCSFSLSKIERATFQTNNQFLGDKSGTGINEVLVTRPGFTGGEVTDFKVQGNTVSIFNGTGNNDYDISNPSQISRPFKYCVFSGQGGGDAKAACEDTVESCVLN